MARYEANADFQRDYYKRRKLAGRSPGNDDEVSIICFPHIEYCTGGLVRSENEARILYTIEKGFILQSKGVHFEKIRRRAYFSSASHGEAWPLHFKFASYTYGTPNRNTARRGL